MPEDESAKNAHQPATGSVLLGRGYSFVCPCCGEKLFLYADVQGGGITVTAEQSIVADNEGEE